MEKGHGPWGRRCLFFLWYYVYFSCFDPFVLNKLVTYFLRCIFLITSHLVIFNYQIVYLRLHQSDKLLILPQYRISWVECPECIQLEPQHVLFAGTVHHFCVLAISMGVCSGLEFSIIAASNVKSWLINTTYNTNCSHIV